MSNRNTILAVLETPCQQLSSLRAEYAIPQRAQDAAGRSIPSKEKYSGKHGLPQWKDLFFPHLNLSDNPNGSARVIRVLKAQRDALLPIVSPTASPHLPLLPLFLPCAPSGAPPAGR